MEKTINKKQILYPAVMYCIFAVFLIGYLSSNIKILTNFISDDAYYYFNTARNVGLGLGMSFDGITKTNGFHPLYMLLCIPIFTFFSNYFYLPLIIMIALNLLLHFFSAYIFYKILVKTTKNLNGSLLIFYNLFI